MKTLIRVFVILFLSASGYQLDAQETYLWNSAGERNYLRPEYYEMYKFDLQTGDRQLLFRLDSIRFVHPNMTGNSFQIISFAFSTDRKTIYFLELEGDVYSYDIASDNVTYIKDLTPGNVDFLWHGYHRTHQIDQINDSLYYIGGFTKGILNVNTFQFTLIRETPSWAAGFTEFELKMFVRKLEKHKDRFIMLDGNVYLGYADLYDPPNNQIAIDKDLSALGYFDDTNLISYQYACDSTVLYTLENKFYMGGRDTIQIDRVDLVTGQITRWKNYIGLSSDNFSTNKIRDVQHFNATEWEGCQRFIDLDKDDSTAPNKDFLIDSLCTYTSLPLSDLDLHINNEYPIDSIDVFILNPRFSQYMHFPTGNFFLKTGPNFWQRIINNGSTSIDDYEYAIRNAYLEIDNDPSTTEVMIGFQVWYNGIVGDTAIATIRIAGPLPSAGRDSTFQFCVDDPLIVLQDLRSIDADPNGKFYDTDFNVINLLPPISAADSMVLHYIVSNGICFDTASNILKINPLPDIQAIHDTIVCPDQIVSVKIVSNADSILWSDGSNSTERDISTSGTYQYTVTNQYGCSANDTFHIAILPPPKYMDIDTSICPESSILVHNIKIIASGVYTDTIQNQAMCDSIITRINVSAAPQIPLLIAGDTTFCAGESTTLTVISPHTDVIWNDGGVSGTIHVSEPGTITVVGTDSHGCIHTKELEITENDGPIIITTDMTDTIFSNALYLNVMYSEGPLTYEWTPSDGLDCSNCAEPKITVDQDRIYTVTVTDTLGCTTTAAISITFVKQNIFLPNAISLNASNSENTIFYPKGNGASTYTLQIFDRWGNIVFNQSDGRVGDPSSGWHPNPRLEEGVYVYVLNILNGLQPIVKYGDVLLLK